MAIGPKRGQLEKNFFEICFYELKMIILLKENVLDGFKAFTSIIRNFQIWRKKRVRGDHRNKGGTIGKKFFRDMFL